MTDSKNINDLKWACRRGMLELDMLLQPFAEKVYPTLTPEQQTNFRDLLQCQDQELFQWLVTRQPVEKKQLIDIINAVRDFGRKK